MTLLLVHPLPMTHISPDCDSFFDARTHARSLSLFLSHAHIRGPSGRLLQYDPTDDSVTILADGIWFANGVGVDVDETYLIVGETLRLGLIKYHLTGTKAGTTEYVVKGDPLNACKLCRMGWD